MKNSPLLPQPHSEQKTTKQKKVTVLLDLQYIDGYYTNKVTCSHESAMLSKIDWKSILF